MILQSKAASLLNIPTTDINVKVKRVGESKLLIALYFYIILPKITEIHSQRNKNVLLVCMRVF